MQGLAGAHPVVFWQAYDSDELYRLREDIKQECRRWIEHNSKPGIHQAYRAPYWVMYAYAHWMRASTQWDASTVDEAFEFGMDFRRYLGAWMHSVGMPQLGMMAVDVEAVYRMLGVGVLPHDLMPVGCSYFNNLESGPVEAATTQTNPNCR